MGHRDRTSRVRAASTRLRAVEIQRGEDPASQVGRATPVDQVQKNMKVDVRISGESRRDGRVESRLFKAPPSPRDYVRRAWSGPLRHGAIAGPMAHRPVSDRSASVLTLRVAFFSGEEVGMRPFAVVTCGALALRPSAA